MLFFIFSFLSITLDLFFCLSLFILVQIQSAFLLGRGFGNNMGQALLPVSEGKSEIHHDTIFTNYWENCE